MSCVLFVVCCVLFVVFCLLCFVAFFVVVFDFFFVVVIVCRLLLVGNRGPYRLSRGYGEPIIVPYP